MCLKQFSFNSKGVFILLTKKGGELIENSTEKRVYEVEDIQEILNIGRTKVYAFIQEVYKTQKPFKVIKIGNVYRIPKVSFDRWLDDEK